MVETSWSAYQKCLPWGGFAQVADRPDHLSKLELETSIDNKTAGRVSSRFVLILRFEILLFAQNDRIC